MKILVEESLLRQALEALERSHPCSSEFFVVEDAKDHENAITALRETLDAAENVKPVARLLYWHGPSHYPVPHGGIAARTYAEFSREDAAKSDSYWKNGEELYTHSAPAIPEGWQLIKRNICSIERTSDQSVGVVFSSCRIASDFEAMLAAAPSYKPQTLTCPACGADRLKEPCKGNFASCPMVGEAYTGGME